MCQQILPWLESLCTIFEVTDAVHSIFAIGKANKKLWKKAILNAAEKRCNSEIGSEDSDFESNIPTGRVTFSLQASSLTEMCECNSEHDVTVVPQLSTCTIYKRCCTNYQLIVGVPIYKRCSTNYQHIFAPFINGAALTINISYN